MHSAETICRQHSLELLPQYFIYRMEVILMVELDNMKVKINSYESPLLEVGDSL